VQIKGDCNKKTFITVLWANKFVLERIQMNSLISCLCAVGLVWVAFSVLGGLLGRGRNRGTNWGNNSYGNQGWGGDTGSFLGGMGLGWLFGSWGNNDHHHHINNHDTIIDSNNDGIPDNGNDNNADGSWLDWGNNNNDSGSWGDDGGGWGGDSGGDSGGGWGGDSA
jgi:hypothetical protein